MGGYRPAMDANGEFVMDANGTFKHDTSIFMIDKLEAQHEERERSEDHEEFHRVRSINKGHKPDKFHKVMKKNAKRSHNAPTWHHHVMGSTHNTSQPRSLPVGQA